MRCVLCIIAISVVSASSHAQEPGSAGKTHAPAVTAVDNPAAGNQNVPGSVTFAFDGGTLRCTFGVSNRNEKPHVSMIVFPSSINAISWASHAQDALESGRWSKLFGKKIVVAAEESMGEPFGGDPITQLLALVA